MPVHQCRADHAVRHHPAKVTRSRLTTAFAHTELLCATPSYFNTLPTELKIEIFTRVLPSYPRFDNTEGPLLLMRVCKSWRNMVLNIPKLWSTFEIEVSGSTRDLNSTRAQDVTIVDTMDRWLKRSKNYPLSVRILHMPLGRTPDRRSARLVAALIPHAHRWRSVHLSIPASDVDVLQGTFCPLSFPQLQALTVCLNGTWSSSSFLDISALDVPWHQLAVLNLQMEHGKLLNLDQCLGILEHAGNVELFRVNMNCVLSQPEIFMKRIDLPKLRTLDLVLHGGDSGSRTPYPDGGRAEAYLTAFLSCLALPRLHDLRLAWFVRSATPAWSASQSSFVAFLRGVAQTVEALNIWYLPLSQDELTECIEVLPGIRKLDLRFPLGDTLNDPITDGFFARCAGGYGTPGPVADASGDAKRRARTRAKAMLLPRLQMLNVHCCGLRYTAEALVAFIEARCASRDTVKTFHLLSMAPVLPSMERRMERYRADGLDISLDTLLVR